MITRDDVLTAGNRIRGRVRRTPLVQVGTPDRPLWLKCEFLQHTGCFKPRGSFNRVLAARDRGDLDPAIGVVAASGGNAGLSTAYAAAAVGVPASVFVPETAPAVKVSRIESYGAKVHLVGREYAEAYEAAVAFAEQSGALFCHAHDGLEISAGAGTIAEEILSDEPAIDTILLAVGGGGMLAGTLASAAGRARVVAVEPRNIPTLDAALRAGARVDVPVSGVAADSLGARVIAETAFEIAQDAPHLENLLVDDHDIIAAREALWSDYRIAAEHGAATAYAALTSGAYRPEGQNIAVIVCGANTPLETLGR
ncbi:threonine/serine dehydratase [Streptomyces sp. GbtcB6]|uniref:threonine/serine dehydratase n=1 Tax=Streptomyces sp. GbtcB6 TaxID=2824751 RepID=UPI001C30CDC3|nr:threonine/serine dehydratase [Streptomyces sp. GbtcB6]